jgi:hypothetical protein
MLIPRPIAFAASEDESWACVLIVIQSNMSIAMIFFMGNLPFFSEIDNLAAGAISGSEE